MADPGKDPRARDERPFEAVLADLEQTVERLERGNLPLADSLAAFERGMGLVASADQRLAAAEARVEVLLRGEGGDDRTAPFGQQYPEVDLDPSRDER
jgi:exodeoxyribonuclease VII small subunit